MSTTMITFIKNATRHDELQGARPQILLHTESSLDIL